MKANDLTGFQFKKTGSGCYLVTYTTTRGDYYKATINDMTIIDATLNAEWAKLKEIKHLLYLVKRYGTHYNNKGIKL